MKKIFLLLLLAQFKFSADAQTDSLTTNEEGEAGMFAQTLVGPRLIAARHEYNDNNMRGALLLYREILLSEPENAAALYGSAQCY